MATATAKKSPAGSAEKKRASAGQKRIRLQCVRSAISSPVKHKKVVRGLGFTRLNQIVERDDSPSIRGMVNKVPHLVKIVA